MVHGKVRRVIWPPDHRKLVSQESPTKRTSESFGTEEKLATTEAQPHLVQNPEVVVAVPGKEESPP